LSLVVAGVAIVPSGGYSARRQSAKARATVALATMVTVMMAGVEAAAAAEGGP